MRKHSIDTNVILRMPHRPGQLARIAKVIGDAGGLLGEIDVLHYGEENTVRDLILETADEAHTERVLADIRALEGVEILEVKDSVFEKHRGGKIKMTSRVEIKQVIDLRYVYTPGVARVCKAIEKDPHLAWDLTAIGNTVGIFTNGTRVLGLGNIGPLASLPVMEGKSVLYDKFANVSAVPMLIDTSDPDEFIETVMRLAKGFGGIHLEDIRIPDCFKIEDELKSRLKKPVMHDDQHGTATVALAAILNACKKNGVDPKASKLGQIGLGAAGSAIARLALAYGMRDVLVTDLSQEAVAAVVKDGARYATLEDLMRESDIVVATTGRPGLIRPDMVRKGHVILSLSNPEPEISPSEARKAGAVFAADGRTVNNALAYPGIFRGVLDTRSEKITKEMFVAVAETLARLAPPEDVVPNPLDLTVHAAVAEAVRDVARKQGLVGTAEV